MNHAERAATNIAEFEREHPAIARWWKDNPSRFAVHMRGKVGRFGMPNAGQLASLYKCANKFANRT